MKNKIIVFGCIISCLILLTIPNISATQYQLTKEVIEDKLEDIQELGVIKEKDEYPILCKILFIISSFAPSISYLFLAAAYILNGLGLIILPMVIFLIFESLFLISEISWRIAKYIGCEWALENQIKEINSTFPPIIQKELYKISSL